MGFADLQRNKGNALQKLQQKVAESTGGAKDPRFWKIPYDAQKVGSSLIRLLPWGDGERTPWVEWAEFSFQGKGGKYWNRSLRTLGENDPVAELNHQHWELSKSLGEDSKTGKEAALAKKRGRKLVYVCNAFILEDNMNPEHVGKVKLFKYGPMIQEKIQKALSPEYKDVAPVQVFDFMDGANFRIRSKGKQLGRDLVPNYEDSAFDAPAPLHTDMSVLENIYNQMIDLAEFEAPTNYKSYADLEKLMFKAIGGAEIARIRGEQYNPAQAAGQGANPFPAANPNAQAGAQQQAAQQQQQQADPFSQSTQAGGDDPFAQAAQGGQADPFAQAGGQQQAAAQQADPFAQAGGQQAAQQPAQQQQADPFAGAAQQDAGQADPFAQAAQGGADPFATTGQADQPTQQQAGGEVDPFANIDL